MRSSYGTVGGPATEAAPLISIAIVNYNSGADLAACLAGLKAQNARAFEVIAVDNASSDGSFDSALAAIPDVPVRPIRLERNCGFAGGDNRAAAAARGTWLATLNPDATPAPDWIAALIAAIGRYPGADMFGSTQVASADPGRLDGAGDCYLFCGLAWRGGHGWPRSAMAADGEVFAPCGAAALYRLDVFRAIGGFDENFFCYLEDIDLGFRIRLRGGRCVQLADAVVAHRDGGTSRTLPGFAGYHSMRNSLWTFVKNMPGRLFWPILPLHLLVLVWHVLRNFRRPQAAALRRGLIDGVLGLGDAFRARRAVQRGRTVPLRRLLPAISWNPAAFRARRPMLRFIDGDLAATPRSTAGA